MNNQKEIELLLSMMREHAEELSARLYDVDHSYSEKFSKQAAWLGKMLTCWRVNGKLPLNRPKPQLVEAAENLHQLHQGIRRLSKNLER